jgi:hypothetical protein
MTLERRVNQGTIYWLMNEILIINWTDNANKPPGYHMH